MLFLFHRIIQASFHGKEVAPQAAENRAEVIEPPPRQPVFTGISDNGCSYRNPSLSLRMTAEGGAFEGFSAALIPTAPPPAFSPYSTRDTPPPCHFERRYMTE